MGGRRHLALVTALALAAALIALIALLAISY
mgnify:CR=1 FL=1